MSDEPGRELLTLIEAVAAETAVYLAGPLVEPKGMLARIESHVTQLRDYLHDATRDPLPPTDLVWQVLIREMRSITDHDAHIMAARHEFTRDFLVALRNDVSELGRRLSAIEDKLHGPAKT